MMKPFISIASAAILLTNCQSTMSLNALQNVEGDPQEYWVYQNCKERTLQPSEVIDSEAPKRLRRIVKLEGEKLTLEFHDEIGEQYNLIVEKPTLKDSKRTLWKGEAKLAHAIEGIDVDPLVIAYELHTNSDGSKSEVIYTKGKIPEVYLEDNVQQAYEVNRYSDDESMMAVLMQTGGAEHDFYIQRACGKAFGFDAKVDRQKATANQFLTEISL